MNKLSELSKPVAWAFKEHVWATGLCGYVWRDKLDDEAPDSECESVKDVSPLYSQEYVSALLAELEAKDKRIGELEELKGLWVEIAKELGSKCDTLEAKLATPVRLPPLMDGELFGKDSATANAHNNAITACSIAIRGAGFKSEATAFKCVGDE